MLAERPRDRILAHILAVISAATPDADGAITVKLPEEECEYTRRYLADGRFRFMSKALTFFGENGPDYCNEDAKPHAGWLGRKW
jgi:hypothetical protein